MTDGTDDHEFVDFSQKPQQPKAEASIDASTHNLKNATKEFKQQEQYEPTPSSEIASPTHNIAAVAKRISKELGLNQNAAKQAAAVGAEMAEAGMRHEPTKPGQPVHAGTGIGVEQSSSKSQGAGR